jgi:enoyl-CoA hydratase
MDFASYKTLSFERRGRILTVTINRPAQHNAVNRDLHEELARVFYELQADPDSDVVVLTGTGRIFCAGGDMDWFEDMIAQPAHFEAIAPDGKKIVFGLLELEKPILCRLNGAAAGLGASIALLCDIIVAADTVKIGDPHVKMGLVAGDGGAVIWPQLIGFAKAKEFLLTGDMIDAREAERIGLINHVVPADQLDSKVYGLAERLASGARQAIRWTKTATNIPLRRIAHEVMDACMGYEIITNTSADHKEAVAAFKEKRPPRFTGR